MGGDGPPYYPVARVIVGGPIFSIVGLLVSPAIYLLLDDASLGRARAECGAHKSLR